MAPAHEDAQRRIIPMRARVLARIAEHLGCDVVDLQGALETDITNILLEECAALLEPWGEDRLTPVRELPTDLAPQLEPVTVTERVTVPASIAPSMSSSIDARADDPWRDEPTVRQRMPSEARKKHRP